MNPASTAVVILIAFLLFLAVRRAVKKGICPDCGKKDGSGGCPHCGGCRPK